MKIIISIFIFCLICCSSLSADENLQAREQIIANVHAMWKAIETKQLDEYMQYIHPDYSLFGEGDAYLHSGKDKERIDIGNYLKRADSMHTFMHQPKVTVRGNTAWLTYYWSDSGEVKGKRFTSRGKSTRIFVKQDDKWLCIHSHFTEQK